MFYTIYTLHYLILFLLFMFYIISFYIVVLIFHFLCIIHMAWASFSSGLQYSHIVVQPPPLSNSRTFPTAPNETLYPLADAPNSFLPPAPGNR